MNEFWVKLKLRIKDPVFLGMAAFGIFKLADHFGYSLDWDQYQFWVNTGLSVFGLAAAWKNYAVK